MRRVAGSPLQIRIERTLGNVHREAEAEEDPDRSADAEAGQVEGLAVQLT
jgi:hypothetical protein